MASAIDVNDPDLRVSKTCQACRAIKLRCVRQADSSKCARCDRLELDCRFVEKKRGRKPRNSQGSSSVKQEIPSPPRVRSPSHSQSAGGNSPPTPSTNTTFSPANQHNQVHHLNQQHQQPQSQQQHHPHQHLPQQSQHQQLPSTLSHSHMDPAAASLAPFQSVLAHPSLAPQSTAPPHPTTQPEPDHHHLRHPASAAANSSLYMADDPENDILPLLEGVVPAGNWLIEHLNELDGNHQAEVVAVMKAVVSTCRALSHSSHDSHAHYTRSFESILQTCFAQLPLLGMTMQSNSGMYGQVNDPLDSNSNTNGSSLSAPPPSATSNGLSSGNAAPHMPMDEIWRDFMPGLGNHLLGWFDAASQQVEDTFQ